jgi:hypothetical protein
MFKIITPKKTVYWKALIIALEPGNYNHFPLKDKQSIRTTISARIKPHYPDRKYKTTTTEKSICVTRLA